MAADPDTVIETLLEAPKTVSSPSGSVTNIDINDAIAADKHLARKAVGTNPFGAVRIAVQRGPKHYGV